jgi:AraC family transcriptional regulator
MFFAKELQGVQTTYEFSKNVKEARQHHRLEYLTALRACNDNIGLRGENQFMMIRLFLKRKSMRDQSFVTSCGTTTLRRLQAGMIETHDAAVTAGFVLTRAPRHESALGKDKFELCPLEAGQGWFLPGGLEFKQRWPDQLQFITVQFSAAALARVNDGQAPAFVPCLQMSDPTFVQLSLNLHETASTEDAVLRMYRETTMVALTAHVNKNYGGAPPERWAYKLDPRLRRAISLVHDQLADNLRLDDLANAAAMSPFHFIRSFKRVTGLAPHQYLAAQRIESAKTLLRTTSLPIAEICNRVGYCNTSHFTRVFKKLTGRTPGEHRNS